MAKLRLLMRALIDMLHVRCRYVLDHGADMNIANGAYGAGDGPVHMYGCDAEYVRNLLWSVGTRWRVEFTKTNADGAAILYIAAQFEDVY
jgi:hypothetical protein